MADCQDIAFPALQHSGQKFRSIMGLEEMNIDIAALVTDKIFFLFQDPVQSRGRYFQKIIVTDGIFFIQYLTEFFTDGLAVFQIDASLLINKNPSIPVPFPDVFHIDEF